jgi:hypothetical protein
MAGVLSGGRVASGHRECLGYVEGLPVLQAAVELAEELVEKVAVGGGMPAAVFPPLAVVLAGGLTVGGSRKGPHPADGGQPVVFDMAAAPERDTREPAITSRRSRIVNLPEQGYDWRTTISPRTAPVCNRPHGSDKPRRSADRTDGRSEVSR